jgi:hypothetical protein
MNDTKFIGLDVHKTSISAAVLDQDGKLVMQSIFATHAAAILGFIHGIGGSLRVTFEEGTHSAWLYDLLRHQVAEVLVCNPRKNALLKSGNKSDQIDCRKLAELLRGGLLSAVNHGQSSALTVKELGRTYTALTEDTIRGDEPVEGVVSQPGDCQRGQEAVHAPAARGNAGLGFGDSA